MFLHPQTVLLPSQLIQTMPVLILPFLKLSFLSLLFCLSVSTAQPEVKAMPGPARPTHPRLLCCQRPTELLRQRHHLPHGQHPKLFCFGALCYQPPGSPPDFEFFFLGVKISNLSCFALDSCAITSSLTA